MAHTGFPIFGMGLLSCGLARLPGEAIVKPRDCTMRTGPGRFAARAFSEVTPSIATLPSLVVACGRADSPAASVACGAWPGHVAAKSKPVADKSG
jgi:hypothetical protein